MPISKIQTSSVSTDVLGPGKNLIINGAMQVAQRGTSFSYNGFGGANFCVDRFWFYNGGGATSGTIEQSTDVPSGEGFAYSLFNNTNANLPSGTNVELTKQGNATPFVVGNTYTLSFWVKGSSASSGISVNINWRNSHANGTNSTQAVASYPTFDVTTSWERVVIPFTLSVSPVSTNNVLDFEYAHPVGAKITGVQLELGSQATPFEHRSYADELARCQRYFARIDGSVSSSMGLGTAHGLDNDTSILDLFAPVRPMRASMTVTISSNSHINVNTAQISASATSVSFSNQSNHSVRTTIDHTAASGSSGGGRLIRFNNASGYIHFDAEL